MDAKNTEDAPWRSGMQGARANLAPGIALQLVALALVLGYYNLEGFHAALTRVAEIRSRMGTVFGVLSTATFGGFLPFLYMRYRRRPAGTQPQYDWIQGLALTGFWAYKGFEVGLWYGFQARMIGGGHDVATVTIKVILDQFVYCPVLAVPLTTVVYQAVDAHGRWAVLASDLREQGWYRRRVLAVLIANIVLWVPAVAVIYALPTALQLPLQNIVLCFYTLVVAHQMRSDPDAVQASG